jgi:hypothetical protein
LRQSQFEPIQDWIAELGDWSFYQLGFGIVRYESDGGFYLKGWFAHYWSIILPLTLISAWCLLTKPRTTEPAAKPEPPHA